MPLQPVFWSFSTTVSHSRCCLGNDSANERGDRNPWLGEGGSEILQTVSVLRLDFVRLSDLRQISQLIDGR